MCLPHRCAGQVKDCILKQSQNSGSQKKRHITCSSSLNVLQERGLFKLITTEMPFNACLPVGPSSLESGEVAVA